MWWVEKTPVSGWPNLGIYQTVAQYMASQLYHTIEFQEMFDFYKACNHAIITPMLVVLIIELWLAHIGSIIGQNRFVDRIDITYQTDLVLNGL